MRGLVLAGLLLALGGCGSGGEENAAANVALPQPAPPPMLGGVNLNQPIRVAGAEPFWTIDIAPGSIVYTDFASGEGEPTDFYPITPKLAGDRATITTQTPAGEAVTITLRAAPCSDAGEKGTVRPLTAEVQIGSRRFAGCAAPAPAEPAPAAPENAAANAAG